MLEPHVKTEVRLYLEQHDPEGLAYIDCPECGAHNKLMLVPMDDGGTFAKCLKASCETFGSVGSTSMYRPTEKKLTTPRRQTYLQYRAVLDFKPVTLGDIRHLSRMFSIRPDTVRERLCTGYLTKEERYVYPIRNQHYREVGYVARSYCAATTTKSLNRPYEQDDFMMAWYGHHLLWTPAGQKKPLILVEDQPSAVRLAEHFPTIALLGTSISDEGVALIDWHATRRLVVVMLDADAAKQAQQIARRLRKGIAWVLTGDDPKDMSTAQFKHTVEAINGI